MVLMKCPWLGSILLLLNPNAYLVTRACGCRCMGCFMCCSPRIMVLKSHIFTSVQIFYINHL